MRPMTPRQASQRTTVRNCRWIHKCERRTTHHHQHLYFDTRRSLHVGLFKAHHQPQWMTGHHRHRQWYKPTSLCAPKLSSPSRNLPQMTMGHYHRQRQCESLRLHVTELPLLPQFFVGRMTHQHRMSSSVTKLCLCVLQQTLRLLQ